MKFEREEKGLCGGTGKIRCDSERLLRCYANRTEGNCICVC